MADPDSVISSSAAVKEKNEAARVAQRILVLYSPVLDPIEKAFFRLKAMLRKTCERRVRGPWDMIGRLVDIFQPNTCSKYCRSFGHEPQ